MSALVLRIIACVAMLLDHIGFLFDVPLLRIVGRISFPIFLFLIYTINLINFRFWFNLWSTSNES